MLHLCCLFCSHTHGDPYVCCIGLGVMFNPSLFLLVMLRWWANMEAGSVVRAMFEFLPSVSEELPLFTGDVIEVLSIVDEFWLLGIKDGVTGKVMRGFTLHCLSVILLLISFHSFCLQASVPALLWNRLQSQAPRQERIYMCASMTLTLWTYH